MPTQISLMSDLIEALGKVVGAVKSLVSLPRAEREKYRQTLDDTHRLIDIPIRNRRGKAIGGM